MSMKEPCPGCGKALGEDDYTHVGIIRDEDGSFAAFPVCEQCFRVPTTRKYVLKMHFFPKGMKDMALERAGSTDIG